MAADGELRLSFEDSEALRTLLGARDAHLKVLAQQTGAKARSRGGEQAGRDLVGVMDRLAIDGRDDVAQHQPASRVRGV